MNLIIGITVATVILVTIIAAIISHLEAKKRNPQTKEQRKQKLKGWLTGSFQGALIITCGIGAALFLLAFVIVSGLSSIFPYEPKESQSYVATYTTVSPSSQPNINEILATPNRPDYSTLLENSTYDAILQAQEDWDAQRERERKYEAAQAQIEKRREARMQQREEAAAALISPATSPYAPDVASAIPENGIDKCGIWVTVYDSCDSYNHVGNEWSIQHYASFDGVNYVLVPDSGAWYSVDTPVTLYVKTIVTEQDDVPDTNTNEYSMDIQTDKSTTTSGSGWTITQWTDVAENMGRYAGNTCTWDTYWNITFLYD